MKKQNVTDVERRAKNEKLRARYNTDPEYAAKHRSAMRRYYRNNQNKINRRTTKYLQDPINRAAHNQRRRLHKKELKLLVLISEKEAMEEALHQKQREIEGCREETKRLELITEHEGIKEVLRKKQREIEECERVIRELEFVDGRTFEGRELRGRS